MGKKSQQEPRCLERTSADGDLLDVCPDRLYGELGRFLNKRFVFWYSMLAMNLVTLEIRFNTERYRKTNVALLLAALSRYLDSTMLLISLNFHHHVHLAVTSRE
jgi:hypothetical protein